MKTNYQNKIEQTQVILDKLPNTIKKFVKSGIIILRVVKNGFDKDGNQLLFIDHLNLNHN